MGEKVQFESFSEFIIVDAILGTGIKGKLRDKVKDLLITKELSDNIQNDLNELKNNN